VRLDCLLPPSIKTVFGLGRVPALARLTRIHVILAMLPELRQYLQYKDQIKNVSLSETMMTTSMGRTALKMAKYLKGIYKSKT